MKAIDEFETERDQQSDEKQQERQKSRGSRAAGVNIRIEAVRHVQQAAREQQQEDDGGARIKRAVELWADSSGTGVQSCLQRDVSHVFRPPKTREASRVWPVNLTDPLQRHGQSGLTAMVPMLPIRRMRAFLISFIVACLGAFAGPASATAEEQSKCAAGPHLLWGDGEHDDTAALNAWFRGETVVWAQSHEPVGAEISD